MRVEHVLPFENDPFRHIMHSMEFANQIEDALSKTNFVNIDFGNSIPNLPGTLLFLSNKIAEWRENGKSIKITFPRNHLAAAHLVSMGFPYGSSQLISNEYSPIIHFTPKNFKESLDILYSNMEVITPSNFGQAPKYILSELTTNIEEHSKFSRGSIMAHYSRKERRLDMAIFDNGLSIPNTLKHVHPDLKDVELIDKALYGSSSKDHEGNRGWGLKSTRRLVLEGLRGKLQVISGRGAILSSAKKILNRRTFGMQLLDGTLIYLRTFLPKKKFGQEFYKYVE